MKNVKVNNPIRYNGEVTTILKLDVRGMIEYKKMENWLQTGRNIYLANIKGTTNSWQISKVAYEAYSAPYQRT